MIAESLVGRGIKHLIITHVSTLRTRGNQRLHKCEPYVYAQMIAGKDAPTHGEAKSLAQRQRRLNYVAITQHILAFAPHSMGWR